MSAWITRRTPTPSPGPGPGWAAGYPNAGEMALAGVTAAAVAGLARLFSDTSFLAPMLIAVVASHSLAMVLRRLGLGLIAAVVVSGLALVVVLGWVVEPQTLTFGFPLGHTWHAIRVDLASAADLFGRVRAPAPTTRGFVVACAAAAWTSSFAADTFAFRARGRFEALVPSFVLFLFGAVLGADRLRLATAGLYLGAVLAFVVLSDPARQAGPAWFAGRSGPGSRAMARSGLATALVVLAITLVVAPRLPGAHATAVVALNADGTGSGSRVTVSPLVDIRSRLVDQSGAELFSVGSAVATYWRLTSLERFDGTIWSSVGSYEPARGRLPGGVASRSDAQIVVQQVEVKSLSAIWLPAAYRPQRFDGISGVRFDSDSASLLTEASSADGLRYSVESSLPHLTAEELATASPALSGGQARRYLDLPSDFPASVRRQAEQVTSAAAACRSLTCGAEEASTGRLTGFHQARALQDWFRTNFTYDLNVPPGHDDSAIQRFLTIKAGYCEQFAGTFAAMARSVGLPSRVAVGFTAGTLGGDRRYHVTGHEAHAWPEVYLDPYGWVAFEPTPGRTHPGTEAYTGITTAASPGTAPPADPTTATPATTAPAAGQPTPTTAAAPPTAAGAGAADKGSGWPVPAILVVALLATAYLIGVPLAYRLRQSRRRARATTPTDRVLLAWSEVEGDLARTGIGQRAAETATEYATRAQTRLPAASVGPAIRELAGQLSSAAYSPAGADEGAADRAEATAATVRTALRTDAGALGRTLWSLDPRPLVRAASPRSAGRPTPRA